MAEVKKLPRYYKRGWAEKVKNKACHKCGEIGHRSRECPHPKYPMKIELGWRRAENYPWPGALQQCLVENCFCSNGKHQSGSPRPRPRRWPAWEPVDRMMDGCAGRAGRAHASGKASPREVLLLEDVLAVVRQSAVIAAFCHYDGAFGVE